jgi:ubiquinone/menaquinone biosynthesis C-methylase UbiE
MVGARGGDRVLVVGVSDAGFAAELALGTGLSGEVRVVDPAPDAATRVEAAIRRSGALVEFDAAPVTRLPYDAGAFDVVIINRQMGGLADADRRACAAEAVRVAKPGGRIVVIEGAIASGFFARLSKPRETLPVDHIQQVLTGAGCRATRELAHVDGTSYVEALTPRLTAST